MTPESFVLATLAAAFTAGAGIIWLAGLSPRYRAATGELWALYRSEFAIVGSLLVPGALGGWFFAAFLLALVRRGQFEIDRLFHVPALGALSAVVMGGGLAIVVFATLGNFLFVIAAFLLACIIVAVFGLVSEKRQHRLRRTAVALATLAVPALLAAAIAGLRGGENGFLWLFTVYATVEIADAFALVTGKLFGRTRIFPQLSPKKTAEGTAGGFILGAGAGYVLAHYLLGLEPLPALGLAAVILMAGLAGDLLTSAVKRWRKAKEFATVLKLHGGVMDIYESFLLAGPAVFLLRPLLAA